VPTISADFRTKTLQFKDEPSVKLEIWDTGRQERSHALTKADVNGVHGIGIVFDIANRDSLQAVPRLAVAVRNATSGYFPYVILIGNKSDLASESGVRWQEASWLARELGIAHISISAKTGDRVSTAFKLIAEEILAAASVLSPTDELVDLPRPGKRAAD
jgi:small GTP-binding protein